MCKSQFIMNHAHTVKNNGVIRRPHVRKLEQIKACGLRILICSLVASQPENNLVHHCAVVLPAEDRIRFLGSRTCGDNSVIRILLSPWPLTRLWLPSKLQRWMLCDRSSGDKTLSREKTLQRRQGLRINRRWLVLNSTLPYSLTSRRKSLFSSSHFATLWISFRRVLFVQRVNIFFVSVTYKRKHRRVVFYTLS